MGKRTLYLQHAAFELPDYTTRLSFIYSSINQNILMKQK